MPNHLYELIDLFSQPRTFGRTSMRLPPEEILQRDFAADGLDLNRALNRMESCLVTMALKRRQLFWEEVDLWLYENKGQSCIYSPKVRTMILKGQPSLSIVWTKIAYRKSKTLIDSGRRDVFSAPLKTGRVSSYTQNDFPMAPPELWQMIQTAEEEFSRIRKLYEKAKLLRRSFGALVGEFNRLQCERFGADFGDSEAVMQMEPVSIHDGPRDGA